MSSWHQLSTTQVLKELNTSPQGLSTAEVKKRQAKFGLNELVELDKTYWYEILFGQFKNIMMLILIVAVIVSAAVGEYIDAVAIGVIVILNAVIGFIQEFKAEKAIEALKRFSAPHAVVIRNKETLQISAKDLVPGDIIILEEGMKIPADSRLLEEAEMSTIESSLTGESTPVSKMVDIVKGKKGIGDLINMVFMGTTIVRGHGMAVVTGTGMKTEFGKIAHLVQSEESGPTPLQTKLDHLSKVLAVVVLGVAAILFTVSFILGRDLIEMFILSISLAVSVIPEGLPAVITLTLAISVQQMAKKNAIIRKLPAAETLGSTSVICTDKTGTLTQNEMTVKRVFLGGRHIEVTGTGYSPNGHFTENDKSLKVDEHLKKILEIGVLCNNSRLISDKKKWVVTGDPTEGCLHTLALKGALKPESTNAKFKRIDELVFDSERKRMSTLNEYRGKKQLLTKGAPDTVIEVCSHILMDGKVKKLTPTLKKQVLKTNEDYAKQALRVLGFAYKDFTGKGKPKEEKMVFVGMVGMIDPPRPEVKRAISMARSAHINVVMITGDHALTAQAIGEQIGLYKTGDDIITGEELESMTARQLKSKVKTIRIFARVNPHHKVKILKAFQSHGEIVAMTGDGVNDAPALKSADIGVAMGITGTDVAKEASEMILTDDNFATIVSSVESGRAIYRNIKKFIRFLLSANFSEVFAISLIFALGMPIPFIPLQILWINLVTDSFPALALGVDPPEKDIMDLQPRNPKSNIFKELLKFSIVCGVLNTAISLFIYFNFIHVAPIEYTRTMVFTGVVVFELLLVFAARSEVDHYFTDFLKNRFLILGILLSFALQIFAIYNPLMQTVLETEALNLNDWVIIFSMCVTAVATVELWKQFRKKPVHV